MPITLPAIDDRRYQQLLDELLARVPVHTPEWTNFNHSDPGVTLVQLFAYLTESFLYRGNLIPERNRHKFLMLLGVPLAPAVEARGLVAINNDRAANVVQTLASDLEVRAGKVAFRTQSGLDVLPVDSRVFFKRPVKSSSASLRDYYKLLYASYQAAFPADADLSLYETVALDSNVVDQVDLNRDAVDHSLWIGLFVRKNDWDPKATDPRKQTRDLLGGRTLSLGLVPALDAVQANLVPGGQGLANDLLVFETPKLGADPDIPRDANGNPLPSYRQLEPRTDVNLLATPGVVQLTLPAAGDLGMWQNLDPLEAGVGDMPPAIGDAALAERLLTWVRVRATGAARARLLWAGINTVVVRQCERIIGESLAPGDGTPDQSRRLARAPVLAGSISVLTRSVNEDRQWTEIDDLLAAGPEVMVPDSSAAPGTPPPLPGNPDVFSADHESGVLQFGDGLRGRRLPRDAQIFASYEFCQGAAGNVAPLAINSAPLLPSGYTVANPVRTWGGADAESVADGEKQIQRFLQHRDRLVSTADFESIAWRAPGVSIGRIDVLPAFHPDLVPNEPGAAPGVVTVMAIPRFDAAQPDAPLPDRFFLNSLCRHLDPRRLVTTELLVRGPVYKGIWISVGVDVAAGLSVAEVVDAIKTALRQYLSPLAPAAADEPVSYAGQAGALFEQVANATARGWPLQTSVNASALLVEVARVSGVTAVPGVLLAEGSKAAAAGVAMTGLELPRILGISVVTGDPVPIESVRGDTSASPTVTPGVGPGLLPVPVVPENC